MPRKKGKGRGQSGAQQQGAAGPSRSNEPVAAAQVPSEVPHQAAPATAEARAPQPAAPQTFASVTGPPGFPAKPALPPAQTPVPQEIFPGGPATASGSGPPGFQASADRPPAKGRGRGKPAASTQIAAGPVSVEPVAQPPGRGRGKPAASTQIAAAPVSVEPVAQLPAQLPVTVPRPQPPVAEGHGTQPAAAQTRPWGPRPPVPSAFPLAAPPEERGARQRVAQTPQQTTVPAQALETLSQQLAVVSMRPKLHVRAVPLPKRSGYGDLGTKIQLISNHYPLHIPDGYIYHYDVEIEPMRAKITPQELEKELQRKSTPQQVSGKRVNARMSREVMGRLFRTEALFNGVIPAYDGNKSMFTRKIINVGPLLVKMVSFREDGRDLDSHFKVSIKPVEKSDGAWSNAINLNCLHALFRGQGNFTDECYQAIMALDIIMRNGPALKQIPVGRSFFLPPRSQEDVHPLSEGKQIWFGYYQTIRPAQRAPMIILDKSHKTFYDPGPLLTYICKYLGKNDPRELVKLSQVDCKRLTNDLKTAQICVTHLPYRRKYRVVRITTSSARELTFPETLKNGKTVQTYVAEYFKKTYKALMYPNLPCVQVHPEIKKIYQPVEVCELVEGQHYKRKLTEDQMAKIIRFTCTTPYDRFKSIQQARDHTVEDNKQYMKEFGLMLDSQPLQLEGRVLQAPQVHYGGGKAINPYNGSWDLRDTRFLKGAEIKCWAILCLANDRFCSLESLNKFARLLQNMGERMGMIIKQPRITEYLGNRGIPSVLQEWKTKYNPDMLVIVLRDRTSYAGIKHVAEIKIGLRTSCIQANNIVRKGTDPTFVCNVLQKINAKYDGQNSMLGPQEIVPIFGTPVIVIGVDVSHPSPGDKVKPSVAAAVGSLDRILHHYAASVKVQQSPHENKQHLEIVDKFKDMVIKLLEAFHQKTRRKPEKIIVYRDGVSEGEFSTVCDYEIPQIDEACLQLQKDGNYLPNVTFIVVQKRHHTRFAPKNPRDGVGKCKNVPPGTTVDKDVIHPVYNDFYLCSHFGIQGSSRPAHYTVLKDDNRLSTNELQKLTFHLCHTYVRCTRSISIPAPVQYAHLAALRARHHLASNVLDDTQSTSSDSSSQVIQLQELLQFQENVNVSQDISGSMYFV